MVSDDSAISGVAARIALGSSMSVFAVVAVLGNLLFWFALLYDRRVSFVIKVF